MACHPTPPFTPEQEARLREIVREERTSEQARIAARGDRARERNRLRNQGSAVSA